ncbi:MlaD family protein [Nocardia donostiensis]|uniref:Mammalian cell entry protein n=1 Tax=Nocardia donostiensis TaxID=1538463 RepID=A0A1V2TD55_9NOCA|nr:MlaD family protein [Nocardia donostiensis]ONM47271.1 mammalian cell entry protein [Nocardia donostiensis]OQS16575.1 mammalian cell entry protein [Nocardia donostiensis]OQS21050.1 mammalian cell entry protein [Nocardia donostiensis]
MKIGSGALASLGGIAAITVLGASYLTFGVVRADPFADYTEATMMLGDSGGLGVGSPVLLTGIEVGQVTSVDRVGDGVEVGFRVDDTRQVPTDSIVTIEHLSALGEPYVQFQPKTGDGPYLRDGQRLRSEDVRTPLSIPEVSRLVTKTMNQLDPTTVGSLVDTMSVALTGTDAVMPELTRAADILAATLISRDPQIGDLLNDFESVSQDIDWAGPATSAAAGEFVRFTEVLDELVESVGRLIETGEAPEMYLEGNGLVPFLQRLTEWLHEAGPELAAMVPALQPLTDALTTTAPRIDLSALISQALRSTDEDSVKLRVTVN